VSVARRLLVLILAVAGIVPAAFAHQTTWRLRDVTFTDGTQATGTFTFNSHTGDITNWNIVTVDGELPAFTYTPDNSTASTFSGAAGPFHFVTEAGARILSLDPVSPLPHGVTAAIPLETGTADSSEQREIPPFGLTLSRFVIGGDLFHVERSIPTLSPGALLALACGLLGVALMVLRR
jgi:hypothetical protein